MTQAMHLVLAVEDEPSPQKMAAAKLLAGAVVLPSWK